MLLEKGCVGFGATVAQATCGSHPGCPTECQPPRSCPRVSNEAPFVTFKALTPGWGNAAEPSLVPFFPTVSTVQTSLG